MNERLINLKNKARKMARERNLPSFYLDYAEETSFASDLFFNHPALLKLQEDAVAFLYDDYMFGIDHSKHLAQDASTLILAWDCGLDHTRQRRAAFLAQVAAMMHDIECSGGESERFDGSAYALLDGCTLSDSEKHLVARASTCHRIPDTSDMPEGSELRILTHALHDAYLFRFGADIFATIMWNYCDYTSQPLTEVAAQFEAALAEVQDAPMEFLTETGRKYGPEILQVGREQAQAMLRLLKEAADQDS
ncbi:MAG: hypothetical protein V3573_00725 [Desulfovibrionaceae bacterium]